ncbi:reverse transcriptase domain-containing protein [Tanacetum coccineum]
MPPKRTAATTTPINNAQIKALIAKGVATALAEYVATRGSSNGDDKSDEVEKYVGGLPDMIQGSVMASKPKTMQDAIEFATELMDQKIRTFANRQAENKRKLDDNLRNNQNQQQPFKRQNVARAYTVGPGEKKLYGGAKPMCPKFNYHHDGQCAPKCTNCKRTGHLARDCRSQPAAANN